MKGLSLSIGFLVATLVAAAPPAASAAQLTSLTITPAEATLPPRQTLQYQARGHYDDGSTGDVTAAVDWSTSSSQVARFGQPAGSVGLLTARAPGSVEVRAALVAGGRRVVQTAIVHVDAGELRDLVTRPSTKRIDLGRPIQFEARLRYTSGFQVDVSERVTWSSSDPAIATISNREQDRGMVLPLALGKTTIQAHDPTTGFTNTDGATDVVAPVTSLTFDASLIVLGRGLSAFVRVYGMRADGTRTNLTDDVEYTLSAPGIATIEAEGDDAGRITSLGTNGAVLIRATDPERGLKTRPRKSLWVVVAGSLARLDVTPAPFTIAVGDERRPTVVGKLDSGLTTPDLRRTIEWSVDDPSLAKVETGGEEAGTVEGLRAGTTTLRAREPSSGILSSASGNLIVRGRVTSVSLDPPSVVLGRGLPFALRAYANRDDGTRSNISGSAQWSVEPAGIVTLEEGMITALEDGVATAQAIDPRTGFSATAQIRVAGAPTALLITPNPLTVEPTQRRKPRAAARLSSGLESSDLRLVLDWSVVDPAIAIVGGGEVDGEEDPLDLDRGEVFGVARGTTTLRAIEPLTGLASSDVNNLRVDLPVSPEPTPRPNPGPTPTRRPSDPDPGEPKPVLVSVVVEEPSGGEVPVGGTATYKARGTFDDGSTKNVSSDCDWSVADTTVATVDNESPGKGVVTGKKLDGVTTVSVVCSGRSAAGNVRVVGQVIGVRIDPPAFEGIFHAVRFDAIPFRAYVKYADGSERDASANVLWRSTNPEVATVEGGADPRVRFQSIGEAQIVATTTSGHSAVSIVRALPEPPE